MRTYIICCLAVFLLFTNMKPVFAQHLHEIDSVMDMSPDHLPTYYTQINFLQFMPLKFKPIDTEMITTHLYAPLLKTENIYQSLGINGQAHQPIVFDYQREMGFLYQALPYPLYFKKQSDLKYYKLQTTYSRAAYTFSFLETAENEISAEFARYMRGVTVAANIYASHNKGSFDNQEIRNLCGDLLIHYEMPSALYGFRASYIVSHVNNRENGGLLDMEAYQSTQSNLSTMTANSEFKVRYPESSKALTKILMHDLALQNYVNLKSKSDRYFGTITYDFQWTQTTLRYNNNIETDFPHYNSKTTNDSTRIATVKNAIQWSNFSPFQAASTESKFFHVAGGLLHDYADLRYTNTPFTSLYLFARTHIRLYNVMDITGQISYSLVSDYANNDIAANTGISWAINREKEHNIGINANYYRNNPEYILQYVSVNNFRWINQFAKQDIVHFKAFWNYQKYNVSASYYYLNNFVYLSEELRPVQNENSGNLIQVSAFIPFRHKNFGTIANLNVQYCTKDVIHVPIFAGKLSVFYVIELLKKRLKIQVGTDLMYNTTYYADAYLPALRKFYYQTSQPIGNFIFMDANVSMSIDRINFFARIGNILPPLMKYRNFTTPDYPVKDYLLSLGITWRFFD